VKWLVKVVRIPKYRQREIGRDILIRRGFEIREKTGRGILPGARLSASKGGETVEVSVKISPERLLGFSRKPNELTWRTLSSVDLVLTIVPSRSATGRLEVYCFEKSRLIEVFDRALDEMRRAGRAPSYEMALFVPLDEPSRKNVGHSEAGLAQLALWTDEVDSDHYQKHFASGQETFVERAKREFAKINGVDVSKVRVRFEIID
jgi:hypothetical protein